MNKELDSKLCPVITSLQAGFSISNNVITKQSRSFLKGELILDSERILNIQLKPKGYQSSTFLPCQYSDLTIHATHYSEPIIKYADVRTLQDKQLGELDFPPFKPDIPTVKPHMCLWEQLNEEDMLSLNAFECEKEDIIHFLAIKFIGEEVEKTIIYDENKMLEEKSEVNKIEENFQKKTVPAVKETTVSDTIIAESEEISRGNNLSKQSVEKALSIKSVEQQSTNESFGYKNRILLELLHEVVRYCRMNKLDNKKTSCLLSIFYYTHQYFKASQWRSAEEVYGYFKEFILLNTVMRPPKSIDILDAEECRSALMHFCIIYLRYLPLLQLLEQPSYQFVINWEPEPEPEPVPEPPPKEESKGKDKKSKKGEKDVKSKKEGLKGNGKGKKDKGKGGKKGKK